MKHSIVGLSFVLLALMVGCGDDDGGSTTPTDAGGDATEMDANTGDGQVMRDATVMPDASADAGLDGSVTVNIEQVVDEAIASFCSFIEGCAADLDGVGVLANLDCERAVAQLLPTGEVQDVIAKVQAGDVTFDAEAFERCLTRIADECIPIDGPLCPEAFTGDVPAEGACLSNYECAGDAYCAFQGQCPGTCVTRLAPGEACSDDIECSANGKDWGECNEDNDQCRSVEIVSTGGEGDDCGAASALGNNLGLALCEKGLVCDFENSQKCVAPPEAGQNCEELGVCAAGSQCLEGTCLSISFVRGAGMGCNAVTAPCDPQAGLACQNGFCVEVSDGASGSPCAFTPLGVLLCDDGLVCRQGPGANPPQCLPPGAEDDPCNNHTQCASGSCEAGSCREAFCGGANAMPPI